MVLEDVLPEGIDNPQFSLDGGGTWDTWSGNWMFGTMEAGEIITVIIQGTFTGSAQPELVNTATVTTTSDDGNEDNNTSTVITPINRSADVSVTKTTDQLYATPGQLLAYTLRIVNNGPDAAENVLVTDMIPEKLYNVEFSVDGGIQWNRGTGNMIWGQ